MALGLYPNPSNEFGPIKPRGKIILNQDNPLVQRKSGLILAWTGSEGEGFRIRDFAQGYPEIIPGSSTHAKWTSGRGMPALDFTGGGKEQRFVRKAGLPTIADATAPFTSLAVFYPTATSGQIWVTFQSVAQNVPGMAVSNTGFLALEEASSPNENSTLTVALNRWHVGAISQTGASARTYMLDGQTSVGSGTIAAQALTNTDPHVLGRFYVNSAAVTADDYKGMIEMVMVWNTALTVPQLKSLASDPYQCFESLQNRTMFLPGVQAAASVGPLIIRRRISRLKPSGPPGPPTARERRTRHGEPPVNVGPLTIKRRISRLKPGVPPPVPGKRKRETAHGFLMPQPKIQPRRKASFRLSPSLLRFLRTLRHPRPTEVAPQPKISRRHYIQAKIPPPVRPKSGRRFRLAPAAAAPTAKIAKRRKGLVQTVLPPRAKAKRSRVPKISSKPPPPPLPDVPITTLGGPTHEVWPYYDSEKLKQYDNDLVSLIGALWDEL